VRADIILKEDYSGTVALEYRVSKLVESLGKQDGNERWLPVPVGRADFDRTLARLPGMSIVAFSSTDDGRDIIIAARLAFTDLNALLGFLDAAGDGAVYARDGGRHTLTFRLRGGSVRPTSDVLALAARLTDGYDVAVSLTLPIAGDLVAPSLPGADIHPSGKTLSCVYPLSALLAAEDNVTLEFKWNE
jgi:hypothetical protein